MHLSGRRDLVRYSLDARSPDITHAGVSSSVPVTVLVRTISITAEVLRVQVVAQLAQAENVHVNERDLGSPVGSLGNNGGKRVVVFLDVRSQVRVLRGDDLGYNDDSLGNNLQDIVNHDSESPGRIRVGLVGRVSAVQVVGGSVDENNVRTGRDASAHSTADSVDREAGMALVIVVGHVSRLLGANEVDLVAAGLQVVEQALTVAVRAASVDIAPGDGVAKGQDPEIGCLACSKDIVGKTAGEGKD
jgi:hypothetical protein